MSRIPFRSNLITGVLVLAPIGAVLGIVVWFWNQLIGLSHVVPYEYSPKVLLGIHSGIAAHLVDFVFTLVVFGIIIVWVWGVGAISSHYLGQRIFVWISQAVSRVPVLSTVYSTLEQLLKTFASGQAKNFRRVVEVEYPRKGIYTLAFVTGEREGHLTIYVPTTPNPTSGFYLIVPSTDVKDAGKTVEEALKEIISMGIVHKG